MYMNLFATICSMQSFKFSLAFHTWSRYLSLWSHYCGNVTIAKRLPFCYGIFNERSPDSVQIFHSHFQPES